jgi:DegV family protein with EDD domain
MNKVAIVTDSTAYLPQDIVDQYQISVVPLILIWGDEELVDGIEITPEEFYNRLETSEVMPSTSQPTPKTFIETYTKLLDQGYDILSVLISSKLSGTIPSAIQAKESFPKDTNIEIIDSYNTAMALGFQALMAARAANDGASLAECKEVALKARDNSGVIFAVDTLEFLHRGGRIGGASRFLGTALNLKPILEVQEGKVEAVERVRTRKKSINRLIELVGERIGDKEPVRLATLHANSEADALTVLNTAAERFNAVETIVSTVSPVIGTHVGPGTVGLAYIAGM